MTSRDVADDVIEEARRLVAAIAEHADRDAAVRLAQLVRREALDERSLLGFARSEELDFADALARLVR